MRVKRIILILVFALLLPLIVGWGPAREMFTLKNPAPFITFDSISDNPNIGDERNFCSARVFNVKNTGWSDLVSIEKSGKYILRLYIENSSADNYNLIAKNTKIKYYIPHIMSNEIMVMAYIEAENSVPTQIYDQVYFESDKKFILEYIPGSALYENNYSVKGGTQLSNDIQTEKGVLVGSKQLNGDFPPGYQYAGYASIQVNAIVEEDIKNIKYNGINDSLKIGIILLLVLLFVILLIVLIIKRASKNSK